MLLDAVVPCPGFCLMLNDHFKMPASIMWTFIFSHIAQKFVRLILGQVLILYGLDSSQVGALQYPHSTHYLISPNQGLGKRAAIKKTERERIVMIDN